MGKDKFIWQESDLEIEHPPGSGKFIPLSEFNRMLKEEKASKKAEKAAEENTPAEGEDEEA